MSQSEIAQLRQRIEEECQAIKQGMTGYAVTSPHSAIEARSNRMSDYQRQLGTMIGQEQSIHVMTTIYHQVMEG